MILTSISSAGLRIPPFPGLKKALAFLRRPDAAFLADGRYVIDGESVFAVVQRYRTRRAASPVFEAHRRYVDLQYLAKGSEKIAVAPLARLRTERRYDRRKDACSGRVERKYVSTISLRGGGLAVLYPEDAHAARLAAGVPGAVLKIVVKVLAP